MQPEVIPTVGSVWGDPRRPETWTEIKLVQSNYIEFYRFSWSAYGVMAPHEWPRWVEAIGAVDITTILKLVPAKE